jgi:hypothetical protein
MKGVSEMLAAAKARNVNSSPTKMDRDSLPKAIKEDMVQQHMS